LEKHFCQWFIHLKSHIYNKKHVFPIAVLQDKYNKDLILIVANVHLIYNFNRGDIKLGQILLLLKYVYLIYNKYYNLCYKT